MNQLHWDQVAQQFEDDGSLRDIYVCDTTVLHWQQTVDGLSAAGYALEYSFDNQICDLPRDIAVVFQATEEHKCLLSVRFKDVIANCHFFTVEQIEFDIAPYEIKGQVQLDALVDFMRCVANATRKEVILTDENWIANVIIRIAGD